MKKRSIVILALMLTVALLGGCNKEGSPDKEESAGTDDGSAVKTEDYVTIGEYKGIEISVPSMAEEELEIETVKYYFDHDDTSARGEITDRAVRLYDMANIDYEGKKDGVAFQGGTAQGADLLIGSGQFIEGFEDGLIGVTPGETVDLNLRFPDSYGNSDLAGQDVVFTVKVNYVSEMQDEQVSGIGLANVTNAEQLRQYIADSNYRDSAENAVMNKVMTDAVFHELPEEMLSESKQLYVDWIGQMAQMYGMDAESFITAQGMDYESLLAEYAEMHTKQQLVIDAIADREGLGLSDEDLDARLIEYAQEQGVTVDELLAGGLNREDFRKNFLYDNVLDFLVENAVNTAAE